MWATFVGKFVANTFQKSPNLVTLSEATKGNGRRYSSSGHSSSAQASSEAHSEAAAAVAVWRNG